MSPDFNQISFNLLHTSVWYDYKLKDCEFFNYLKKSKIAGDSEVLISHERN